MNKKIFVFVSLLTMLFSHENFSMKKWGGTTTINTWPFKKHIEYPTLKPLQNESFKR